MQPPVPWSRDPWSSWLQPLPLPSPPCPPPWPSWPSRRWNWNMSRQQMMHSHPEVIVMSVIKHGHTQTHTRTVLSNFSWLLEPKQWCRWGLIKQEDVNSVSTASLRAEERCRRFYSTSMRPLPTLASIQMTVHIHTSGYFLESESWSGWCAFALDFGSKQGILDVSCADTWDNIQMHYCKRSSVSSFKGSCCMLAISNFHKKMK